MSELSRESLARVRAAAGRNPGRSADAAGQDVIDWARAMVSEGRRLRWIADELARRKVPPPSGTLWTFAAVQSLLRRR